ncbi:MAG: hypothetical protein PHV59_02110 [Victivallales bacterium]|nr:hypothetical protein [Victivallales bacterium]
MSLISIVLVLVSAGLHAGWNLICKAKSPSGAFFLISTCSSVLAMTPLYIYFSPLLEQIPGIVWILLAVTGFFEALYYVGLGNAYRLSEVSLAYPLIRSLPVLLVPTVCFIMGQGKSIGLAALSGMLLVAAGCIVLPLPSFRTFSLKHYFNDACLFVLMAAAGTTAYTIIDSTAVNILRNEVFGSVASPLFYIAAENVFILLFLTPYVLFSRREAAALKVIWRDFRRFPLASGVICTSSYACILGAMQFAVNVSYISAFRQLSIPLGVIMGVVFFREKAAGPKIAGVILILSGLVLVAVG